MAQTLIQTLTVGAGGATSIDFTGIPNTFTDIVVVLSSRSTNSAATGSLYMSINGVTTNRTARLLYGNGSSAGSATLSDHFLFDIVGNTATANTFSNSVFYFPNYAGSTNKSFSADSVNENNATASNQYIEAGLWSSTAAITSLSFFPIGFNLVQGSTASLYGVLKDNILPQPKATGGTITKSGSYWVHTFTASGTFTPTTNLTGVEYLVIAGGGAGGYGSVGGGGGAGGYRSSVIGQTSGGGAAAEGTLSLTSGTGYTVTIGAGGAAVTDNVTRNSGSNTTFASITATAGGGGGTSNGDAYNDGLNGGSGGGASLSGAATSNVGTGTTNQGYAGGNDNGSNQSGGGGGASAVGNTNGTGGAGQTSNINGTATYRAGGGAGANTGSTVVGGGAGGGGNSASGTYTTAAGAGSVNTGSGGGGGSNAGYANGGAGGSGIVIVRYAA